MTYLTKRNYDTFRYGVRAGHALGKFAKRAYANRQRIAGKLGTAGGKGRRRRGGRFARKVRKVLLQTTESRYVSKSIDGTSVNHDSLQVLNVWSETVTNIWPAQGLTDASRTGDEIYVTGLMCRMVFQIPHDRRNTKFKIWWVPHNSTQGSPNTKTEFFHTVSNNVMVDPIQTDRWQGTKYLGCFGVRATDQTTGSQDKTVIVKKWIPLNRKVTFQQDASQLPASGVTERGWIIIGAYDTITSVTTDTLITNSECAFTLYYKSP